MTDWPGTAVVAGSRRQRSQRRKRSQWRKRSLWGRRRRRQDSRHGDEEPPHDTGATRRGSTATWARRGGKTVVALVSAVVMVVSWYGWQFIGDVNSGLSTTDVFDEDRAGAAPMDGAIDILLVGQDSRTDAHGNPLPRKVLDKLHAGDADGERQTDTMILVHIPQDGRGATAISFPRDAWVDLANEYGTHKLNSAFGRAYTYTSKQLHARDDLDEEEIEERAQVAGRKNLIASIEKLIDRPGMIDRYAEVNLASFHEITSTLGGVDVCLNNDVKDKRSGLDLSAGRHTLQGVDALSFVRQRYNLPNGDLDRIARQQAFLSGLVRKMLSPDVLFDPNKIGEVVKAVQSSVVLSEDWDLMQFAAQMRNMSGGNIEFRTIPVEGNAWFGNALALEIDVDEVRSFVDEVVGDEERDSSSAPDVDAGEYTVDVYSAATDPAHGESVRSLLRDNGFQGEGSAIVDTVTEPVVRHAPGEDDAAEAAAALLGPDVGVEEDSALPEGKLEVHVDAGFVPGQPAGGSETSRSVAPASLSEPVVTGQGAPHGARQPAPAQTDESDEPTEPITAGGIPCVN
ncbi:MULTISPECIES: LCP family protein [Prauserella salsuginis group]|uniref:LCP family protein n=1 Tax=Prauserella salsuginis TaxID=387889 RepID=A0ABW6G6R2_9PSEU|nr:MULTISPECIES: LCP family protein [Prauserella salsuginis group]MCR3722717.1 transcriptional attenuator, LytR family [Prauserella flava]MCR3737228.1 transcriptional attenuator, LytR family [Prauserella salsuginis]